MVGIYKITSPSGKVYIGQSWNIERRFQYYKRYKCKEQPKLYSSLIKYTWENHVFEVVHELPNDIEQKILDEYELLYLQQYKDCGIKVLNLQEPGRGGKHSEETIRKMSDAKKGKSFTEEHRQRLSESHKGQRRSDEMMKKLHEGNKGRKLSEEAKQRISDANKKHWKERLKK